MSIGMIGIMFPTSAPNDIHTYRQTNMIMHANSRLQAIFKGVNANWQMGDAKFNQNKSK